MILEEVATIRYIIYIQGTATVVVKKTFHTTQIDLHVNILSERVTPSQQTCLKE